MNEPTVQQVIDGFRYGLLLGGIEERANGIASYLMRSPRLMVMVDRIEGTVAHFIQQAMLDDSENFRIRGCMGDNVRFETSRFEINMAPQTAG
jgi:hypothetical protein